MSPSIYLNLGSGQRKFSPPWINVDIQAKHQPDVISSAEDYLTGQIRDSVDMICLHHVLEHYGCGEAKPLLARCHRALKPLHSLLVFVPNIPELFAMWGEYKINDQLLMTNLYGAYIGDEADRHKWGFTASLLEKTLKDAGFIYVTGFNWRTIQGADIARDRWILGMEAVK